MTELATLGGGCFWCLEAIFQELKGVEKVESGYAGGATARPTYEAVCTGTTGHAEVVQITFDPAVIRFHDILEVFFSTHDPTTLNRQGSDVGTQYRSAIFYHTPDQQAVAVQVMAQIGQAGIWDGKIVTHVSPFTEFYRAEPYHQEYYRNNAGQPYCQMVIAPKVAAFRRHRLARLLK